jgi:predicted metalloendopeptidase
LVRRLANLGAERTDEMVGRQPRESREAADHRANGPVSNLRGFYEAFNVSPGDRLYRDATRRVSFW